MYTSLMQPTKSLFLTWGKKGMSIKKERVWNSRRNLGGSNDLEVSGEAREAPKLKGAGQIQESVAGFSDIRAVTFQDFACTSSTSGWTQLIGILQGEFGVTVLSNAQGNSLSGEKMMIAINLCNGKIASSWDQARRQSSFMHFMQSVCFLKCNLIYKHFQEEVMSQRRGQK